jgi:alkanesulfonate monooxygenase SsuD/methylene tetrahydromethanopterin reductase-like flavin-dependent oxidoreductase (luciferase family)
MTSAAERGHPLRFGIITPQIGRSWSELVDIWSRAEAAGYDSAWVVDHFMGEGDAEDDPTLEAWTLLAGLAREVPRLTIGTYVSGITHRPPAVLLKNAVTIDHLSAGRLIFGIGAAWNQREHLAYGLPFPGPAERVGLVGETLDALRRLETRRRATVAAKSLALDDAPFAPKPVNGRLPVMIGSTGRMMLRHAARHADYWDAGGSAERVSELGVLLDGHCRDLGRDPSEIVWMIEDHGHADRQTESGFRTRVAEYASVGVSHFLINLYPRWDVDTIERLAPVATELRSD